MKYSALNTGDLYTIFCNGKPAGGQEEFFSFLSVSTLNTGITLNADTQPTNFHAAEIMFVNRAVQVFQESSGHLKILRRQHD